MPALTWKHHTLIQAVQSRGPLTDQEFRSVFTGVTGQNPVTRQELFNDYLLKINKEMSYVQLELQAFRNQYDGRVHYGVVSTISDEQSKLGTKYSVPQVAFFKAIVEAIAQDATGKGCISKFDALNILLEDQVLNRMESQAEGSSQQRPPAFKNLIPSAFRNFSMSQKEKTIAEFIEDKWLTDCPDHSIGLGVKAFLELRGWFLGNGVPPCDVCNEPGVKAYLCPNEGCNVRMHEYCLKRKFSQRKENRICPGCGTPWQSVVPKAEFIEEDNHSEFTQAEASQTSMRKRLRSRKR